MNQKNNEERINIIDQELNALYKLLDELNNEPVHPNESFEEFIGRRLPFNDQIEKLDRERRLLMSPTYSPISSYGSVMPLKSFIEACNEGMFIDYDGHGYYVKDDQETDIAIYPSDIEHKSVRTDFDTIIWFNK